MTRAQGGHEDPNGLVIVPFAVNARNRSHTVTERLLTP